MKGRSRWERNFLSRHVIQGIYVRANLHQWGHESNYLEDLHLTSAADDEMHFRCYSQTPPWDQPTPAHVALVVGIPFAMYII